MAESVKTPVSLMDLPPELHLMIASYLPYPDAESLKGTNRYFHNTIDAGTFQLLFSPPD